MNYHKKLYSTYVSTHTSHLYGEPSLEIIKRQFPVWKRYLGRFLPQNKDVNILDAGCGNGGFVYWLQYLGFINASGIDISAEQVDVARGLGISNIECADLTKFLEGREETFDVIFARDLIEHFTKDEIFRVLTLIFSSLKQGGIAVFKTINGEAPFGSRLRYGDITHEIAFTRRSLNQVLRTVGFKDTHFYPTGPVPHGIKSAVRYVLWQTIQIIIRFYMLVETAYVDGIYIQNIIALARKWA